MQRYVLISILVWLGSMLPAVAQFDYGNDWYRNAADQPYAKLVVEETGIYRVSAAELASAGYDLSGEDPRTLRLIYRGQEVPIYVSTTNGQLDFIEFFGQENDGWLDSLLYRDPISGVHRPELQTNASINLFDKSSAYFLTWGSIPGRRIFSLFDPTYNLYTPLNSFRYESRIDYPNSQYSVGGGGSYDVFYSLNSDYVTGEGYLGPGFGYGTARSVGLQTPGVVGDGNAELRTRIFMRSNTPHNILIVHNGNGASPVLDTSVNQASGNVLIRTFTRPIEEALQSTTDLTYEAFHFPTDNNDVAWASVTYDRSPDLLGDSTLTLVEYDYSDKQLLRLANVTGSDTLIVYDPVNQVRNVGLIQDNVARVIIQGFGNSRPLYAVTDAGIRRPEIVPASLNRLYEGSAEYVIISHRNLAESAEAYANYRDTATVTPVNGVQLVYVDEIYDEFGYGSATPWALKRFCKYALDNWSTPPKYFFLWGKGRYELRKISDEATVVPTFGYPSTDYEYIAHFDQNSSAVNPEAAIGRVNARNDQEGFAYLNKINQYEHTPWQPWMKQGVFLGGGKTLNEQNDIESAFEFALDIYQGEPFAGIPYYFQKRSNDVILDPNEASYHDRISEGVNLIHFFGHSTRNILDISIRNANEYNNYGRYPFMVAMGCYGGDFSSNNSRSFGEEWVVTPERGAIGYMANSSAGYLDPLRDYARVLYLYMYDNRLGEPVGDIIRTHLDQYTDSLIGPQFRNHGRQMNLQGDPALVVHYPSKTDLHVDASSVFFTPETITAQDDSFTLNLIIRNYGLMTRDSFRLTLSQRIPDGRTFVQVDSMLPMVAYEDTFSFVLQNPVGNLMTGQNLFDIFVDADEVIEEYDESNNRITYRQLVPGNIPAPLYPAEFAIVPESSLELRASAFFMTEDDNVPFIFEIDTTDQFNSPLKQNSGTVLGTATLASWQVPFTLKDSSVYFWRVRLGNVSPASWSTSSFKYIEGRTGWAQANFSQFSKNSLSGLVQDNIQRVWGFRQFGVDFEFNVNNNSGNFTDFRNGNVVADPSNFGYFQNHVVVAVIDQYTLERLSYSYDRLAVLPLRAPNEIYQLNQIISNVKQGDYVIVASHRDPQVTQWPPSVFEALAEIGASDQIRYLADTSRFVILGRKGTGTPAVEVFAPNNANNELQILTTFTSNFDRGSITSTIVGPALSWESMVWDWRSQDPIVQENVLTDIWGVRRDGSDSLIYEQVARGSFDLSQIDASHFPYLRLEADASDSVRLTAPQLDNWHVLYDPAPDAAVDLLTNFEFQSDTLYDGQEIYLRMAARNISSVDMDSVDVRVSLTRPDRSILRADSIRIPPMLVGGPAVPFEFTIPTRDQELVGEIEMTVELNPGQEPPEQHTFNNLYLRSFRVIGDDRNPVMDVTFDGKHILDGDIISPQPEIVVEVNDDNAFVAMDDTTSFTLLFSAGSNNLLDTGRVFISSDPRVVWEPAELPENKARLRFYPGKDNPLPDGTYNLKVQSRDAKGNAAGGGPDFYEISFNVENQSTLTHVFNYPNPFSTSTRFVYTLTGAEVPEVFQIHIYTISGKIVKVIDLKAMGDVFIGNNITRYSWDGTDEFGDRLANGVYLYRVVTKMSNGIANPELRATGQEKYFRNGWGKMVIIR